MSAGTVCCVPQVTERVMGNWVQEAKTRAFEAEAAVWAQTGKCDCGMLWKRQILGWLQGLGRVCP